MQRNQQQSILGWNSRRPRERRHLSTRSKWLEPDTPSEWLEPDRLLLSKKLNVLTDILSAYCDEEDDPDFVKPTKASFDLAKGLVEGAYTEITQDIPSPKVIADEVGGIRLRWVKGEKEIRLSCHRDSALQSYIYHQKGEVHGLVYDVTPEKLIYWLRWLINA